MRFSVHFHAKRFIDGLRVHRCLLNCVVDDKTEFILLHSRFLRKAFCVTLKWLSREFMNLWMLKRHRKKEYQIYCCLCLFFIMKKRRNVELHVKGVLEINIKIVYFIASQHFRCICINFSCLRASLFMQNILRKLHDLTSLKHISKRFSNSTLASYHVCSLSVSYRSRDT